MQLKNIYHLLALARLRPYRESEQDLGPVVREQMLLLE